MSHSTSELKRLKYEMSNIENNIIPIELKKYIDTHWTYISMSASPFYVAYDTHGSRVTYFPNILNVAPYFCINFNGQEHSGIPEDYFKSIYKKIVLLGNFK